MTDHDDSAERVTIVTLSRIEAMSLSDLVTQFVDVVASADTGADVDGASREADPAVERLTPSAYPDDEVADAEFRDVTRRETLDRRRADAQLLLGSLAGIAQASQMPGGSGSDAGQATEEESDDVVDVALDDETAWAWMRTLTAVRLVIASRLGIDTEDEDHGDPDDPRFAVYDWLGYRLEGIVGALSPDD